jgi:hypothetical protein
VKLGLVNDARGKPLRLPEEVGVWIFDEDDYLLLALLCDPIYCAELLGEDPSNHDYGGAYVVRDYQYPLFRLAEIALYAGATCARTVGKTESVKWRAVSHAFKRIAENLLVTAPELIHLLPLTDAIEDIYRRIRLLRDFLDLRGGKTGFTHRPFGIDLTDGTKIVGRIPRLTGTGVKGQHQPDLIVDEGQDYPEKGWTEVHETVLKDHVDQDGNPDFTYHFYGVHSGATDSGFHKRSKGGEFKIVQITAMQRPGWSRSEKAAARAAYGGSQSPDYKRNILGEQGGGASQIFVTSRLVACLDQDRESKYNTVEVVPTMLRDPDNEKKQLIRAEEFDELDMLIGDILDLPSGYSNVWGGLDFGLTAAPTVITLFHEEKVKGTLRLKLIRRIHFERMRTKTIREALYAIAWHFGGALRGFGMDVTGLGFPIWQEMEDDESCPPHLLDVSRGYFFNAKVPVGVDKRYITEDGQGRLRDQYGAAVVEETDPLTGVTRYVTHMPMVEASTRYLRAMVDSGLLMLPFDPEITSDMQGETAQRIRRISGLKNKPNAFHILDAMRGMAMVYNAGEIEAELEYEKQVPVLDAA